MLYYIVLTLVVILMILSRAIAKDDNNNIYVTGMTKSYDFPTVNAFQPTTGGNKDVFVAKINNDGSQLKYSTYLGGIYNEFGNGIALDENNNAYVTGVTVSYDFPVSGNAIQRVFIGIDSPFRIIYDAFVSKISSTGNDLIYSTYLGGTGNDVAHGIAVDKQNNAYVTGQTESANFPTTNSYQPVYGGGEYDVFVSKINYDGSSFVYSTFIGSEKLGRSDCNCCR